MQRYNKHKGVKWFTDAAQMSLSAKSIQRVIKQMALLLDPYMSSY